MARNSWDGEREQDQQWKPRYKGYKKSKGRGGGGGGEISLSKTTVLRKF